ncbi:MAG: family 43 glycosylhydrolase [Sporocytophaga sp.]|uniref:family 43 glycosylhydrolase n=1 Tax=Sporocytophaga sp. TaxID=2231183 RepID=UPI001B10C8F3|nr:family 43 glycosylhydrolase [Sporocytophaga sp.]MBO9701394.1 family 43 glycosylhydrolase [Sporocytophaga sp.]
MKKTLHSLRLIDVQREQTQSMIKKMFSYDNRFPIRLFIYEDFIKAVSIGKHISLTFIAFLLVTFSNVYGQKIQNDVFWKDTQGNPIYSQGGGTLKVGNTYYWYGVKYRGAVTYYNDPYSGKNGDIAFQGITCYSSTDLTNWKFEGYALTPSEINGGWIGRVGVAYNRTTKKYVLLSQLNDGLMFATCNTPNGRFTYHHTQTKIQNVVNDMTGDQSVYTDEDGQAYLVYSNREGRSHLYVSALRTSDFLNAEPAVNIYNSRSGGREGSIMFKQNGTYYFCSSDLHGWNTSKTYCITAKNIFGPYSSEFVIQGTSADYSHVTQCGLAVEVKGTKGSFVIFGGDRWADFAGNGVGYNQWIPISFNGNTPVFNSLSQWNIDAAEGTWSVGSGNNYVLNPNFEADRISVTSVTGWSKTGIIGGNTGGSHDPGRYALSQSSSSAYQSTIYQNITLPNGTYTLSAWVKSSGGQKAANIYAKNFGGSEMNYSINRSMGNWTKVTISNINVTNGTIQVGVFSDANAGNWVNVDDFSLVRTDGNDCSSVTTVVPYYQLNGGAWVQGATASTDVGGKVVLGPQPASGGTWSWTGPEGFTSANREITLDNIQQNQAGNYVATFKNTEGCTSMGTFTVTVCSPTTVTHYVQIDGGAWIQTSSESVNAGSTVRFGPHPMTVGTWSWTGPNGFTATTREVTINSIQENQAGNYVAAYTDASGCQSKGTLEVTVNTITNTVSPFEARSLATILPNPAETSFNVTVQDEANSIEVIDIRGLVLFAHGKVGKGESIDFGSDLASGLYTLMIRYTNGRLEAKRVQKL